MANRLLRPPQALDCLPGHFLVVEVKNVTPDDLIILMTFARDQYEVISTSLFDGVMNGCPPVGNLFVGLAGLPNSLLRVAKNLVGILSPRIVRSQNHHVA